MAAAMTHDPAPRRGRAHLAALRTRRWVLLLGAIGVLGVAAPASAGGAPWELNRATGRETVIAAYEYDNAIAVVPGSTTGPNESRSRLLTDSELELDSLADRAVGSGDVDGDGDGDLVIGAPYSGSSGEVAVVPGAAGGPDTSKSYVLSNTDEAEYFGAELLVADLDRDGFSDVVATEYSSYEAVVDAPNRTYLTIYWGSSARLSATRSHRFVLPPKMGERLLLRAANVIGDARRELVAVYPGFGSVDGDGEPGALQLCTVGSARGVTCTVPQLTTPDVADMVAADAVGGDHADVVLGLPGTRGSDKCCIGALAVYRGGATGLSSPTSVTQGTSGVPGTNEWFDQFGSALATADLNRNGKADIAIGATGENNYAGRITVVYGHRDGLGRAGGFSFSQNTAGVPDTSERSDRFGSDLSLLDVDGNGRFDLLAGSTGENGGVGSVTVIRSDANGRFVYTRSQSIFPGDVGMPRRDPQGHPVEFGSTIGGG